jgi:hypothetical protein
MDKKIMTSIKLQHVLHRRMLQRIIADGYGMRGKSKWIIEAIEALLEINDYPTLVDIAEDMNELTDIISIRMPDYLAHKIDHAIIEVRKKYPTLEGVKSNLIRASILQRLLRSPTSVPEV